MTSLCLNRTKSLLARSTVVFVILSCRLQISRGAPSLTQGFEFALYYLSVRLNPESSRHKIVGELDTNQSRHRVSTTMGWKAIRAPHVGRYFLTKKKGPTVVEPSKVCASPER